jgi:Protein of unknown function (DUF3224)
MNTISTFEIKSWDEQPYAEGTDQPKLTQTVATKTFTGDIEGEATVAYLMVYRPDGSTIITGFERVAGSVGGRTGSFVLRHEGTDQDGAVTCTCTVVSGSGTGDLANLRGEGHFTAKSMTVEFTFDYQF